MSMTNEEETKRWAGRRFGIPPENVLWYNSGICYDRIGVKTKADADKVAAKMKGRYVNGGMYDGMPLGNASYYKGSANKLVLEPYYDVMC